MATTSRGDGDTAEASVGSPPPPISSTQPNATGDYRAASDMSICVTDENSGVCPIKTWVKIRQVIVAFVETRVARKATACVDIDIDTSHCQRSLPIKNNADKATEHYAVTPSNASGRSSSPKHSSRG
jgi:hypothetical protein